MRYLCPVCRSENLGVPHEMGSEPCFDTGYSEVVVVAGCLDCGAAFEATDVMEVGEAEEVSASPAVLVVNPLTESIQRSL